MLGKCLAVLTQQDWSVGTLSFILSWGFRAVPLGMWSHLGRETTPMEEQGRTVWEYV